MCDGVVYLGYGGMAMKPAREIAENTILSLAAGNGYCANPDCHAGAFLPEDTEQMEAALHEYARPLVEAIRLTIEYHPLPAIDGWTWWDAYRHYATEDEVAEIKRICDRTTPRRLPPEGGADMSDSEDRWYKDKKERGIPEEPTPAQESCGRALYGPPTACTCGACKPTPDGYHNPDNPR